MIVHQPQFGRMAEPDLIYKMCPGGGPGGWCPRCRDGKGGFVFRWYSVLWNDRYCELAAPHCWRPGQAEGYVLGDTYGSPIVSQLASSTGHLLA